MKKFIAILLVVALTATIAIGGTLAYLTDRDSEVNTFTVGDVKIDLQETFVPDSALVPGVKIEKDVAIQNIGENEAWVWYTYAVPTALINTGANASKNAIHFNIPGRNWDTYRENKSYWEEGQTEAVALENTWHWEKMDVDAVTIDEVNYTVVTVLYNGILSVDEMTTLGLEQVYLDTHVDIDTNGDWYWIDNGTATSLNWNTTTNGAPKIIVSAYAIQADGFADVNAAYAAYQKQWGDNGAEYAPAEDPTEPADPNATGTITPAYTSADGIWGEGTGSANRSFVVKVYSGDTYMGSTSLNNINGIIDGDVYVTWNITLDGESTDYWTMNWAIAPSKDVRPTKVELWVDGTEVAESAVQLNGPDSLNKIGGAVTDSTGKILKYVVGNEIPALGTGEQYHSFN